ncbi:MAG TPA: hypothetical protein VLB01_02675 [Thermodesulfobacteriota bacterium]|nr:hypothetical protein [Thermodesulfobacteriota bacterium]
MQGTLRFLFMAGFWVGLLILYLTKGKYLIKRATYKIESMGKRHYIPYPYTYKRASYKSRSKHKTLIVSALPWIALALMIAGFVAMLV